MKKNLKQIPAGVPTQANQSTSKHFNQKTGSIALISILIIGAFVLILSIAMSEINVSTSYQYLNNSADKTSTYTAESCLEEAIIRLEQDSSFTGGTINIPNASSCTMTISGTTINIAVTFIDYTQNYQAQISSTTVGLANNVRLLIWKEI